jgi:protein O-GlcNAc transferase
MNNPLLTIGIPVHNEEQFLDKTIYSAMNQSLHNIRILIADNCSTDNSYRIMQSFAKNDNRVEIARHANNIGALKNFKYLLYQANTKYFMWLGGHDIIPNNYTYNLINKILLNKASIMSFGGVDYIDIDENIIDLYHYHFNGELLSFDKFFRVYSLVKNLSDCTLIHGVFLTEMLKKSYFDKPCLGVDHIILTKAISFGRFVYDINTKYQRRIVKKESYLEANERRIKVIGDSNEKLDNNFKDMQIEQLQIIKNLKTRNLFKKTMWICKSKRILRKKLGRF